MSIQRWKRILNLGHMPSFDDIHGLDDKELVNLYFVSDPGLHGFKNDLLDDMSEKYPSLSMRIEGPPGWGKTSFFHYLSAIVNPDLTFPRYLRVVNATSFASFEGIKSNTMVTQCYKAIESFYLSCCCDTSMVTDQQEYENRDDADKLHFYIDYIDTHIKDFSRRLVVILDGVDTIPEKYVAEISIELFNILSSTNIIKWLAIRDNVFRSYSNEVKQCVRTHFSHRREFPRVPLHGIIKKRIRNCGSEHVINPFSRGLCSVIQDLCGGDNRIGLATLKSIMNTADPGKLPKSPININAIQQLFEAQLVTVALDNGLVPNIFDSYANINTLFPIAKEVLLLAAYLMEVDQKFCDFVSLSLTQKLSSVRRKTIDLMTIDDKDIKAAIAFLEQEKLVEIRVRDPLTVEISKKGELTSQWVEHDFYQVACKEALEKHSIAKDELFWKIASEPSDFSESVRKKLYGTI